MPTITPANDAYGHELWACLTEGCAIEIVERDDGFIDTSDWPRRYFADFEGWPKHEQRAIRLAHGSRALDVGCGAGRVSLYLQQEGWQVTAIDNSPLAIRLCRKRGVRDARVLPVEGISRLSAVTFDTIVMFGNNFGVLGNFEQAKRILRQLDRLTTSGAVILAASLDPYRRTLAAHQRYRRRNRERGRMGGQIRIRVRFREIKGPWFDYLLVSPREMATIAAGTGWRLRTTIRSGIGPGYVGIITKEPGCL
jgi:SAM-dependent methyltransferase